MESMVQRDAFRLPSLFKEAIERSSLRLSEIVRRTGCSQRKLSVNCERLRAVLAGTLPRLEHALLFARALGLDVDLVAASHAHDRRIHEELHERERREWEASATEPVTPTVIYEAVVSVVVFVKHPVPAGATRDEAIELARSIALRTGNRVFVPAFRHVSLLITREGEQLVDSAYGGDVRGRLLRLENGRLTFPAGRS